MKKIKWIRLVVLIIFIADLLLLFGMLHYQNIKGPKNEMIMSLINGTPGAIFIGVSIVVIAPLTLVYLYETSHFNEKYGDFTEDLLLKKQINPDAIKTYTYNPDRMKNYFKRNYPQIVPDNVDELPNKEKQRIDDEVAKILENFTEEQIAEICNDPTYDDI